uniref:ADP-ribosylation factor-like protein 2 n=1 Tax=Cacopsylla melanoneura TaxID=428564 RepID=A0A8D8PYY1_9HEMI
MSSKIKLLMIASSGIIASACTYATYQYWKKRRQSQPEDEGFEEVSKVEDIFQRKILIVGLDGSGKSTLIKQISSGNTSLSHNLKPTEGFNITILQKGEYTMNIFELGGQENVRRFWNTYFEDTDLLVFVVDSADQSKLPDAASELKNLLGDRRLSTVPILVIANKQDIPGALSADEVGVALDLSSISSRQHRIKVIATQAPSNQNHLHVSVVEAEQAMYALSQV